MAETTSASSTAARKAATTRKTNAAAASTSARKAATTRKTNAVKRSTTAKKAAATRSATTAAKQAAQAKQEMKTPVVRAGGMAEKAVLVQVGATLIARDTLMEAVAGLRAKYSTRRKTEQELRRFERRGSTAVKAIERDVKRSRGRIEQELRAMVKDFEQRTEPVTKNVELVTKNVELVTARVENVVAGGRSAAAKVQERITGLA